MKKLKILAPVNSAYGAKMMIKAGADEFYLGLDVPELKKLTLTSRTRKELSGIKNVLNPKEFEEITKIAHDADVEVFLTANTPNLPQPQEREISGDGLNIVKLYLEMVHKGQDLGADAVIVGGMTPLLELTSSGIDLPVHTGTFFNVFNKGQTEFLKNIGVKRVTYPYHTTFEDIEKTATVDALEYDVFGHYSCGGINGLCFFHHVNEGALTLQRPCRNSYNVKSSFCSIEDQTFLDTNLDCSVCSLRELANLNIHSIKIVGREMSIVLTAPIVKMYRKCINAIYEGTSSKELRIMVSKDPFWVKYFCNQHRCKYRARENLKAMI